MANTKISELTSLGTSPDGADIIPITDVSATATKSVTVTNLLGAVDIDTPLTKTLRGTNNPHMGAFPNQSFKVIDNPDQSVMVVADENSLKFLLGSSANVFVVKGTGTPSRLAEASELPAFTTTKDATEPDIELTDSDGEVYSVVNGDSDSIGGNGPVSYTHLTLPTKA